MKPDLYTKIALTVIAGALLLLVARSFQNPAPAFAQRPAAQESPQHVIIDGVQNVMIDGISPTMRNLPVTIADVSLPAMRANPLPVSVNGPQHVIVDSSPPPSSLVPLKSDTLPQKWQYFIAGCGEETINKRGLEGWELVQAFWGPNIQAPKPKNKTVDEVTLCYFKRPTGQ